MLYAVPAIVVGLFVLVWSADRFIDGAAAVAKIAGMPTLLIGVVVVGFGTSAPEMVVSAMAALDGNPELGLGNAIGSNIVNTGMVLGITALMAPIIVHSKIITREMPLLLGLSALVGYLMWDSTLTRMESVLLLFGFFALILWGVYSALRGKGDSLEAEVEQELSTQAMSMNQSLFMLISGLILLVVSSRVLVWGAVIIAEKLGVSDLIIGLTIVALGTSLPELAASVAAARKGEHDIVIGNIVGSNMFNLLAVIGLAGVISPLANITPAALSRDWLTMMVMMIVLAFMMFKFRGRSVVGRKAGACLLLLFVVYNVYLIAAIGW